MKEPSDSDLLNKLYIAAPCSVPWDSMEGDDRVRHCGQCALNVYDVSKLTTKEAADLIRNKEDRLCMRLYRRADGTIITDNCPVGLRRIRDRLKLTAAAVLAIFVILGFMDSAQAQGLVGAPVDPRYGQSGPSDLMEPLVSATLYWHTPIPYILSAALAIWAHLRQRRATYFLCSFFIVAVAGATGFVAALYPQVHRWY
ncbi:MAG: hypothetical protein KC652_17585 [Cyanobacteria bacterium HKST-UBA01]|nr:hypothetical protein [Cyanobacteria bacterium HKST-UBA01]